MSTTISQIQLYGKESDKIQFATNNAWSANLINGKKVLQLNIFALPGSVFTVNKHGGRKITINDSGIFALDCTTQPLEELYLSKYSYNKLQANVASHFIIIDMICVEKKEDTNNE